MAETTAGKATRQREKPERRCKLLRDGVGALTLTITVGKKQDAYALAEIGADAGRGFELTKNDGTVYHVNADGMMSSCDCKGHLRWGHCKHLDALLALQVAGRL
jgi:hypothetical protein